MRTEVSLSRLGLQAVHNYVNTFLTRDQQESTAYVDAKVVRRVVAKACDRSGDGTEVIELFNVNGRNGIEPHQVEFKVSTKMGNCLHVA